MIAQSGDGQANPSTLVCALNALGREFLAFQFSYPLEVDEAAGPPDSLHYYLYSNRLKWEHMRMGPDGIPRTWGRTTGTNYWPAYVAWYGVVELGSYLRGCGIQHLDAFRKQAAWLETNATTRQDGSVVWTMNFDYPECGIVLRKPWISAHAQGLAMSALVRAWRLEKTNALESILARSPGAFDRDVSEGGLRVLIGGNCFYTEVPGGPAPGILDGFLTSLLGLYDVYQSTSDKRTWNLFCRGVEGLAQLLPFWDYRGKWSWYGCHERLCPPQYHCLNCVLLKALGRISGVSAFSEYADRWNPDNLSRLDRAEIHLGFLATQTLARLRRRTWTHRTISSTA